MIRTYYSGGASNSAPAASIGGAISSVAILGEVLSWDPATPSGIAGITLLGGFNNVEDPITGIGGTPAKLVYDKELKLLTFTPYGTTISASVALTTSGNYNIEATVSGTKRSVSVAVVYGSLPTGTGTVSANLKVEYTAGQVLRDIDQQTATVGRTYYRCVYVKNDDTVARSLSVYVYAQPRASDSIRIGLGAVNATAALLASEDAVPAGVSFSAPATVADGLPLTLAAGAYAALWIEHHVPAFSMVGSDRDSFSIAYEVAP